MTSYSHNYYLQNRAKLQDNQRRYEYEKYNSDKEHKLFKLYQSRIDNHFGTGKYKAEDLLSCLKTFFKTYTAESRKELIEQCAKDGANCTAIEAHLISVLGTPFFRLDLVIYEITMKDAQPPEPLARQSPMVFRTPLKTPANARRIVFEGNLTSGSPLFKKQFDNCCATF